MVKSVIQVMIVVAVCGGGSAIAFGQSSDEYLERMLDTNEQTVLGDLTLLDKETQELLEGVFDVGRLRKEVRIRLQLRANKLRHELELIERTTALTDRQIRESEEEARQLREHVRRQYAEVASTGLPIPSIQVAEKLSESCFAELQKIDWESGTEEAMVEQSKGARNTAVEEARLRAVEIRRHEMMKLLESLQARLDALQRDGDENSDSLKLRQEVLDKLLTAKQQLSHASAEAMVVQEEIKAAKAQASTQLAIGIRRLKQRRVNVERQVERLSRQMHLLQNVKRDEDLARVQNELVRELTRQKMELELQSGRSVVLLETIVDALADAKASVDGEGGGEETEETGE